MTAGHRGGVSEVAGGAPTHTEEWKHTQQRQGHGEGQGPHLWRAQAVQHQARHCYQLRDREGASDGNVRSQLLIHYTAAREVKGRGGGQRRGVRGHGRGGGQEDPGRVFYPTWAWGTRTRPPLSWLRPSRWAWPCRTHSMMLRSHGTRCSPSPAPCWTTCWPPRSGRWCVRAAGPPTLPHRLSVSTLLSPLVRPVLFCAQAVVNLVEVLLWGLFRCLVHAALTALSDYEAAVRGRPIFHTSTRVRMWCAFPLCPHRPPRSARSTSCSSSLCLRRRC